MSYTEALALITKLAELKAPYALPTGEPLPLANRIKHCVDAYGWASIGATYQPLTIPATLADNPTLAELFVGVPQPSTSAITLTAGQEKAHRKLLAFLASTARFFVLKGYAGTGKTFLIQKLLEDYALLLTAPTNKAAKVMAGMLKRPAKTIYSLLGITMDAEEEHLVLKYPDELPKAIRGSTVVIDECSMLNKQLLKFIIRAARELDLKIIFIGDPAQLRPVGETVSPVWRLATDLPSECKALLTEVKRFDDQLLVVATALRTALKNRDYDIDFRQFDDGKKVWSLTNDHFEEEMLKYAGKSRVVAWRNRTVEAYNEAIRRRLGYLMPYCAGDLIMTAAPVREDGSIIATIDEEFTVRDVKDVTINGIPAWRLFCSDADDSKLTLNIPTRPGSRQLDAKLTDLAEAAKLPKLSPKERKTRWSMFWDLKNSFHKARYGWAITAHRAQGSTFDRVFVDQQDILANREVREAHQCLYVAASRASDSLYFNL